MDDITIFSRAGNRAQILKKVSLLFKSFLLVFVVFIAISAIVAVFVDINQYKDNIASLVKDETGLDLEIKGTLNLSIISGLKFHAREIRLSAGKELIADIEFLSLGTTFVSLLQRSPKITSLQIDARSLNIVRDKNGQYNFNTSPVSSIREQDELSKKADNDSFALQDLNIDNIKLFVNKFTYIDDLQQLNFNFEAVEAGLSLLPIIKNSELVIDDPRLLVMYSYSGQLTIKKALLNKYQVSNLILDFKNNEGNLQTDDFSFQLLKEGKAHQLPPLVVNTLGDLKFNLDYKLAKNGTAPSWSKPDLFKIEQMNFKFPELKLIISDTKLETENAQLKISEQLIAEGQQFTFDNLIIHSLNFISESFNVSLNKDDSYRFKSVKLQINEFPLFKQGKPHDFLSENFFRQFVKKGRIDFSSDKLTNKAHSLEKLKLVVKTNGKQINLSKLSFNAKDSNLASEGFISLKNNIPEWEIKIRSEKFNLAPIHEFISIDPQLKGYVSIDNKFQGVIKNADFTTNQGKVNLHSKDLIVNGLELDKILDDFQSSQSVGLLDVGAVALLGPAGVMVTKGNDYRKLTKSIAVRGKSKIIQANSQISIQNNIATMQDVAFSTTRHRLAVQGKIDTQAGKFIDFKIATVDKNGCPIYEEQVTGSITSPSVKKVNVVVSGVVNPVNSLVSRVKKQIKQQCKSPFYQGVVKHPVP
jgi:hypothetical protein